MKIVLTQTLPVSFMFAKKGDTLKIIRTFPRVGEYRDKIGTPTESYLAFKGKTKIGMIPKEIIATHGKECIKEFCKVEKIDKKNNIIIVEI